MLQYKRRIQYFPIWKMLCRKEKLHAYYFRKRSKDRFNERTTKSSKTTGWLRLDPIGQSGGFLSSLFGSKPNVDCDASVVMLEGDRF